MWRPVSLKGWFGSVRVYASAFKHAPVAVDLRILLASELRHLPHDMLVPAEDFGLPDKKAMRFAIREAIRVAANGGTIAIGCMGGIGRTGTFLGCLQRTLSPFSDGVDEVRAAYLKYAIETKAQEAFVRGYRDWWGTVLSSKIP